MTAAVLFLQGLCVEGRMLVVFMNSQFLIIFTVITNIDKLCRVRLRIKAILTVFSQLAIGNALSIISSLLSIISDLNVRPGVPHVSACGNLASDLTLNEISLVR